MTTAIHPESSFDPSQSQLAENPAKYEQAQARRSARAALRKGDATRIEEHVLAASDELLRVSAGLQTVLTLLDHQIDLGAEATGLHALLSPLKRQIDENADRLQALI